VCSAVRDSNEACVLCAVQIGTVSQLMCFVQCNVRM